MKYFLLIITVSFLSCKSSPKTPAGKLQAAVEEFERDGRNIDHLKIDSFRYSLGGLQDYYYRTIAIENDARATYIKLLSDSRLISSYGLISNLSHSIAVIDDKIKIIGDKIEPENGKQTVYTVDYFIDYQTDKSNHQGHEQRYFWASNLKPVSIDTDSLYEHSRQKNNIPYDSISDVTILRRIDSFLIEKDKAKTDLRMKIARGTNQGVILSQELQIANYDVLISGLRVKYPHLFMY